MDNGNNTKSPERRKATRSHADDLYYTALRTKVRLANLEPLTTADQILIAKMLESALEEYEKAKKAEQS